jgi:hypothetical protein
MATIIQRSDEAHIGLLEYKTAKEMFKKLFFAKWMGFVEQSKMTGEEVAPVAPVVMKKAFVEDGMDNMTLPMLLNLTGTPIYGDKQESGQGESQRLNYAKVFINMRSRPVAPPARMSNQRVKPLKLIEASRKQLTDWLARDTEIQMVSAFYELYSRNVTAATVDGGLGQTKRYHPNIYAADSGAVSWSGTVATHIASIHAANQGLAAGAADDRMSAVALHKFKSYCSKKELMPINIDGFEFIPLLIHENQWTQLVLDPEFRATMNNAIPRDLKNNPLLNDACGYFAGFALYKREFSVFGLSSTASALTWGATNPLTGVDTYDTKAAIAFGMGSLYGGWAFGPNYETEKTNMGKNQETSVQMIDGFGRGDSYDSSSSPTSVVQKSSALLLTNSPDSVI